MITGSLARRYARALVMIAQEKGKVDRYGEELDALSEVYGSSADVANLLLSRFVESSTKQKVVGILKEQLKLSEDVESLLTLMIKRGRIPELMGVARAYEKIADEIAGRIRATVVSSHPLGGKQKKLLQKRLASLTGKEVILTDDVDANLIGGIKVLVDGVLYDGSIRGELNRLGMELNAT